MSTHDDDGVTNDDDSKVECSPHNPGVDVALHNDKAVQQDAAQQQQHAQAVGHNNIPGDHGSASKDADAHLVGHKHNGPKHEEPARHVTLKP